MRTGAITPPFRIRVTPRSFAILASVSSLLRIMTLSHTVVENSFNFDADHVSQLQSAWNELIALSVWGDISFSKIGAQPRFRKRLLEAGENLRSLLADKSWIPQPREQLKNALGSSVKLRDSLTALYASAEHMSAGQDMQSMRSQLDEWNAQLIEFISQHENTWAEQLDSLHGRDEED